MRFDYQMYLKSDFYVPLGVLLFGIAFIAVNIAGFIQNFESKNRFQYLIPFLFGLFFIILSLCQMIRGMAILKDRDLETFEVAGKVEKIEEVLFGTRHTIGRDIRTSVYITVNGERYYSVSLPGIYEGDYVKLDVFTNSKFVSRCEKVSDYENAQVDCSD